MLPFKLLFYTTLISLICIISTDHAIQLYPNTLKLGTPDINATITDGIPDDNSGMPPGIFNAPESINPPNPGTNSKYRDWVAGLSEDPGNVGTINVVLSEGLGSLLYAGFTPANYDPDDPQSRCSDRQLSGDGYYCPPCMTSSWGVTASACIKGIHGLLINARSENAFSYIKLQHFTSKNIRARNYNLAPSLYFNSGAAPDSEINAFNSIDPPHKGSRPFNPGILGIQYEKGRIIFQGRHSNGSTPPDMASVIHNGKMAIGTSLIRSNNLYVNGDMSFNRGTGGFGHIDKITNSSLINCSDLSVSSNLTLEYEIPSGLTTLIIGNITVYKDNENDTLALRLKAVVRSNEPVYSSYSRFEYQNNANEEASFFNTLVINEDDSDRSVSINYEAKLFNDSGGEIVENPNLNQCVIQQNNFNILVYSIAAD